MNWMSSVRWAAGLALSSLLFLGSLFAVDRLAARYDLDYLPARGRPNEDQMLNRPEFSVRVVNNALGFREPRLPSPKPPHTIRIVCLGDSFTQGYGVTEEQAWPRRLEALLNARDPSQRYEVINLGVPGTSPRDQIGHLRSPGLAYHPDVVLEDVMANDVDDVLTQRRFGVQFGAGALREVQQELVDDRPRWRTLPRQLWPSLYTLAWNSAQNFHWLHSGPPAAAAAAGSAGGGHGLRVPPERWRDVVLALAERVGDREATAAALDRLDQSEVQGLLPVLTGAVPLDSPEAVDPYMRVIALAEPRLYADAVLLPPTYDEAWAATAGYLRRIITTAERAHARPVIAFLPASHQVTPAARPALESLGFVWDPRTLVDTTLADRVGSVAQAAGVPFVDLLPVMRRNADRPIYFLRDGHWTPEGHALAAAALVDTVAAASRPDGAHDSPSRQ